MYKFEISSNTSDEKYVFSNQDGEYFTFAVVGSNLSAKIRVCTYTDELGILKLFESANKSMKPWDGSKSWESLEGEFKIELSCSSTGQVKIFVAMCKSRGGINSWVIKFNLNTELGELTSIEDKLRKFFCQDN